MESGGKNLLDPVKYFSLVRYTFTEMRDMTLVHQRLSGNGDVGVHSEPWALLWWFGSWFWCFLKAHVLKRLSPKFYGNEINDDLVQLGHSGSRTSRRALDNMLLEGHTLERVGSISKPKSGLASLCPFLLPDSLYDCPLLAFYHQQLSSDSATMGPPRECGPPKL